MAYQALCTKLEGMLAKKCTKLEGMCEKGEGRQHAVAEFDFSAAGVLVCPQFEVALTIVSGNDEQHVVYAGTCIPQADKELIRQRWQNAVQVFLCRDYSCLLFYAECFRNPVFSA